MIKYEKLQLTHNITYEVPTHFGRKS